MKVIRLNEASTGEINNWKAKWNDQTINKLELVKEILFVDLDYIDEKVVDKILSFGEQFVVNWVNAMKLEEIGFNGNEFIKLLQETDNLFSNVNSVEYLKNKENFSKIYNVYARGLLEPKYFNDNVYKTLLNSHDVYQYDQEQFNEIFTIFNQLKDKGIDEKTIKSIFIEGGEDGTVIDTIVNIKNKASEYIDIGSKNKTPSVKEITDENKKQVKEFTDKYIEVIKNTYNDEVAQMVQDDLYGNFNLG